MRTTTVVIGAGHTGLAVSHLLSRRSIDHVVLERGEVANTWRTERWDALRLLTPNWQTTLPGLAYDGDDPDGFMTMPEIVGFLDRYAHLTDPPLHTRTTVTSVRRDGDGYEVVTDRGVWSCLSVVLATGGVQPAQGAARGRRSSLLGRLGDPVRLSPPLGPTGGRRPGGGSVGHRRAAGRRDPPVRATGDGGGGRGTSACRGCTAARTSGTGSRSPACPASATTRWTTSCGPARFPRPSWWGRRSG